ncbi:MAG: hypothetical protein J0H39_14710 [Alphaproteobacteria bacterium]|nr:hypothetical protein [Alphaproteobacteria bacterium]
MPDANSDFDIAKNISSLLEKIDDARRTRILRWVAESLELPPSQLDLQVTSTTTAVDQQHIAPTHQAARSASSTNIRSFVESKAPKSDIQFATVVAYFYQFEAIMSDRKNAITPTLLQEATRLCGRERLKSPKQTLNNAKKQGYLDSVSRGEFKINTVGENLVAMTLPNSADRTPKRNTKPKPRSKKN